MKTDLIVIGAGASGLMCAIEAGKRGRSVLVLEHTERIGNKIRVSGGGRCNFTNRNVSRENFLSENPHFTTSALSRYTPTDFISLVEQHGIRYEERDGGRLFCSGSAQEIVGMLEAECDRASVKFLLNCRVSDIRKESHFTVSTDRGPFKSESLVIATGGLSAPQLGATNFGHAVARRFDMKVTALRPALTPLRWSREDAAVFGTLSGIAIDTVVRADGATFRENLLFTHRGLSGPAILQASSIWDGSGSITIDLLPDVDIRSVLMERRRSRMLLATLLAQHLPGRLVKLWCDLHFTSRPLDQISPKELDAVARTLHNWQIWPAGTEGFNKAEVTRGGVDTRELSSKTMESTRMPGLYFTGEVLDVTGQLGGFNLHWAWASGVAAGQAA